MRTTKPTTGKPGGAPSRGPVPPRRGRGLPRAWVAMGRVDPDGRRASTLASTATSIFAVSVNSSVPATVRARIQLMDDIAQSLRSRVPSGTGSLWVFPGGYFGFNAAVNNWTGLQTAELDALKHEIRRISPTFPVGSILMFGVDLGAERPQQAWIAECGVRNAIIGQVTRGKTPLHQRVFSVGLHHAAVFVCGEFTGSQTDNNGPFFIDTEGTPTYLNAPEQQLRHCQILVDLAHQRVSGSVHASPNRRMVHQRQMERFSRHGVAVLTHHHDGVQNAGRANFKHQSNWIVFPEGEWVSDVDVADVP